MEYLEACFNEQSIAQRLSTVEMQTFRVPVVDEADQLISRHFEEAIKFTDQALKVGGRVLFHCKVRCFACVDRIPTVVWLMIAWL